ncbi:MAG: tetratricopeptide repeat protein [Chloroflexaceae bacterium]|nr:tetratricopeptide repeat protein [Chloroflexaceae bacterium]
MSLQHHLSSPSDAQPSHSQTTLTAPLLSIYLLGGFRVSLGGEPIAEAAWRRRKAKAIIKLLALAPSHRLHREQLLEALWPDSDPAAAANTLYVTLHAARAALDPHTSGRFLCFDGDQLLLCRDGHIVVDAVAFETAAAEARHSSTLERYAAALACYTGDLLPEDRYEEWVVSHHERLRDLRLGLLVEHAELLAAQGLLHDATSAYQQVLAIDLAQEEAHVGLMRLYASRGQAHQALRQYQRLVEALRQELDAEPDPQVQALYRTIANGSFTPVATPTSQSAAPAAPRTHNLPAQLTSFIGRERECATVIELVTTQRLVTLTGTGGNGKTRLALHVAEQLVGRYPAGVWLVELSALSDPALVPQALASVLEVREAPGSDMLTTLVDSLQEKHLLLLLDNCEHLVETCAQLVAHLLSACPRLHLLATSREALRVRGEHPWRVPGLALPDAQAAPPVEALGAYEAVRLFVERAQVQQPSFTLTAHNGRWVAEICQRLDGIPLAIELAAARVGLLTIEQLAARLDHMLGLLTHGERTRAPRHQTLRATLDWSYSLLNQDEQQLFARLAVFAGGWTLEAAEAVTASGTVAANGVLDLLAHLVDKSLVSIEMTGTGGVRYYLLETIRAYGQMQLETKGELAVIARQHAHYYLTLAEQAEHGMKGPDQQEWLERLEQEFSNLRTALRWSLATGETELGLRLAASLARFWLIRGYFAEGGGWFETLLAQDIDNIPTSLRSQALKLAGTLHGSQGDNQRATALFEEGLALARQQNDWQTVASLLNNLGVLALLQDNYQHAVTLLEEALSLNRTLGNLHSIITTLGNLGGVALAQGDWQRATTWTEEGLPLARRVGNTHFIANFILNLGEAATAQGNSKRALQLLEESLMLAREIKSPATTADVLRSLAFALICTGEHERPAKLIEESLTIRQQLHDQRGTAESLNALALVADLQGDDERAATQYRESLLICSQINYKTLGVLCLKGLAHLAQQQGQPERAAHLWGAAESLHETIGQPRTPVAYALYDDSMAQGHVACSDPPLAAAWAAGRAMSFKQAVAFALGEATPTVEKL